MNPAIVVAIFLVAPLAAVAQIEVSYQGNQIQNGSTPSAGKGTDFGSLGVSSGARSRSFQITNRIANATLNLRLDLLGPVEGFQITPSVNVPPSSSAEFTITFDPADGGSREQLVQISSTSGPGVGFVFFIGGTGLGPEIEVFFLPDGGNSVPITDGDRTADEESGTHFGGVLVGQAVTHQFRIRNPGTSSLTLFDRTSNSQFDVSDLPSTIAVGGSVDFEITFAPNLSGELRRDEIEFSTNDVNERTFCFRVEGDVVMQPDILLTHGMTPIPHESTKTSAELNTDFGSVGVGGGVVQRFTIRNRGSLHMQVSGVTTDDPAFIPYTVGSFVGVDGFVSLDIAFQPTVVGRTEATVTVFSNDPETPEYRFRIGGEAIALPALKILLQETAGAGEELVHEVRVYGSRGYRYQLEHSRDLVRWTPNQVVNGNLTFSIFRNGENAELALEIEASRIGGSLDSGYFLRVIRRPIVFF